MASVAAAPPTLTSGDEQASSDEQQQQHHQEHEDELLPAPSSWFDESKGSCARTPLSSSNPVPFNDDSDSVGLVKDIQDDERLRVSPLPSPACTTPPRASPVQTRTNSNHYQQQQKQSRVLGEPLPSPSWKEISSQVLPSAARELLSSSMQRIVHTARLSYARGRWQRKYTELGNNAGGYSRPLDIAVTSDAVFDVQLPSFSSLPWVDRQLVQEWRTWGEDPQTEEGDFERARTVVPTPAVKPQWQKAEACSSCRKTFGPTRLRHHCRLCGKSFCQAHTLSSHRLPHLGYDPDVPERVCDGCKRLLLDHNLAERVAWRLARCRDHCNDDLAPYFETGVDTMEEVALRITQAAVAMARSIPLGAQATVAVETVDVLRKHGLNGIYTIMLRQEFLAAADLLRKALGINRTAWPLSVHELTAAIFYALAQHRAMRGLNPEGEHTIHAFRESESTVDRLVLEKGLEGTEQLYSRHSGRVSDLVSIKDDAPETGSSLATPDAAGHDVRFLPVCSPVPDEVIQSLIFYAPLALNFIYAEKEVDMQLLAAQQGWRLLYAHLETLCSHPGEDLPASALFVHDERKILCLSIRGTTTISDVVTDLRQVAVSFPESDVDRSSDKNEEEWTSIRGGQGIAVCGMSQAAVNLYQEHIDAILFYASLGYRIRLTGHSLGGGVASLLGILVYRDLVELSHVNSRKELGSFETDEEATLKVYSYGSPSCVDRSLSEFVESFVVSAVLHDDVVPRLTPTSCRGLLKYLLHIRETWVKEHLPGDIMAITDRAKSAWAPRWRGSFTLPTSSSSIKRYCRKHIQYGKKTLLSVREKIVGEDGGPLLRIAMNDNQCAEQQTVAVSACGPDRPQNGEGVTQNLVLDYMGGLDVTASVGVVIEGDEFFDAGSSSLEENDDTDSFEDGYDKNGRTRLEVPAGSLSTETKYDEEMDDEAPGAVVLEETPLHRMYLPGKIVHIYAHRGIYKAAYVPRDFRELRRISLAGNMLSDHKCKPYYEALLEVKTVRRATEGPPRWTAFDEDDTCSCCASRFTWASTSDSEAQEARDKHNCRSCGTLVCDPCSRNRVPLPSIGLTVAARVCDRCYNDIDGIFASSTEVEMKTCGGSASVDLHDKLYSDDGLPVRQRGRRSAVVDDLAARVQRTPMPCT